MSVRLRILCVILSLGWMIAATLAPAHAAIIQSASGNTAAQDGGDVAGVLNYAVLDTSGGNLIDPWGLGGLSGLALQGQFAAGAGSGALDTGAKYLYLYQATNATDSGGLLDNVTLHLNSGANLTSWGSFGFLGLLDADGPVTASDKAGSTGNDFGSPGIVGDPSLGVSSPGITAILDGASPSEVVFDGAFDFFNAAFALGHPDDLEPGERSTIFGFTSDQAPAFTDFLLRGPFGPSGGTAPSPVPGPPTLLGIVSLLPFAGMYWRRRSRCRPAEPLPD